LSSAVSKVVVAIMLSAVSLDVLASPLDCSFEAEDADALYCCSTIQQYRVSRSNYGCMIYFVIVLKYFCYAAEATF
jgi:hypothetical protein